MFFYYSFFVLILVTCTFETLALNVIRNQTAKNHLTLQLGSLFYQNNNKKIVTTPQKCILCITEIRNNIVIKQIHS